MGKIASFAGGALGTAVGGPLGGAIGASLGGTLGGIAGGQKKRTSATSESGINLADPTAFENFLAGGQQGQFSDLQRLVQAGPGQEDVTGGLGASRDLGALLQQLQSTSGLPTSGDISAAQGITGQLFQPQQVAFQQQLEQARTESDRRRAQLGRGAADPILAAKLAQEAARGQERIGAAQGAATQQLALQLPGQRLGFATQRASLLSGLGSQALQARTGLLGQGSQLLGQQQAFRLGTGTRFGSQAGSSGGGLGGAISGALAGAGAGLGAVGSFQQSGAFSNLLNSQAQQQQVGQISPTFATSANQAIPQFNPFGGSR